MPDLHTVHPGLSAQQNLTDFLVDWISLSFPDLYLLFHHDILGEFIRNYKALGYSREHNISPVLTELAFWW